MKFIFLLLLSFSLSANAAPVFKQIGTNEDFDFNIDINSVKIDKIKNTVDATLRLNFKKLTKKTEVDGWIKIEEYEAQAQCNKSKVLIERITYYDVDEQHMGSELINQSLDIDKKNSTQALNKFYDISCKVKQVKKKPTLMI